jgi:hypothetical protein
MHVRSLLDTSFIKCDGIELLLAEDFDEGYIIDFNTGKLIYSGANEGIKLEV